MIISISRQALKSLRQFINKRLKPAFLSASMLVLAFPNPGLSQELAQPLNVGPVPDATISSYYDGTTLPIAAKREPRRTMKIVVTAYNSEPGQTDDTPWITASGTTCRDGVVAANFLPIGAIVRFPDLYGDKEFVVEDRMNARYYYKIDIWMADHSDAIKFGAKYVKVEIL